MAHNNSCEESRFPKLPESQRQNKVAFYPAVISVLSSPKGILGTVKSGKSALVHRYLTGSYLGLEPTEGEVPFFPARVPFSALNPLHIHSGIFLPKQSLRMQEATKGKNRRSVCILTGHATEELPEIRSLT